MKGIIFFGRVGSDLGLLVSTKRIYGMGNALVDIGLRASKAFWASSLRTELDI